MDKQTQKKLLATVKRNYEQIADNFNAARNGRLWPELLKFTGQINDGDAILDVGCGNGRLLSELKNKTIVYLGIDASTELMKLAEKKYPRHKFAPGDILKLGEIPDINFDYVFCLAVLHHIPGKNLRIDALKQLKNKLSQNGKIILTVWNMWSKKWRKKNFRKIIIKFLLLKLLRKNKMDFGDILFDWKNNKNQAFSQRYYHAFGKRELKKIIKKAGLKTEKLYKDEYNYYLVLKKHKMPNASFYDYKPKKI